MKKLIITLLAAIILPLSGYIWLFQPAASALSGSQFQPGRIIDDTVFYNASSMTANDIQNFLNAQMPNCDTNGTQSYSYYYNSSTGETHSSYFSGGTYVTTSRATFGQRVDTWLKKTGGASQGSVAPYICLRNYVQNTPAENADSGICGYLPARSSQTAANIIAQISAACGVSPKVLIVLLQKEQGLVTDDWPWGIEYQEATGYGCPDTSVCASQYYGFFNQVYHAAWQFKEYRANPTNFNFVAGQTNNIPYNPNGSCGTKSVFIETQATAGLYDYTPYVPNAAALKNVSSTSSGGLGDSCSAYGNRNFWWYYSTWFGSTLASPFFRVNNGTAIYVLGVNSNYYWVQNNSQLQNYGYGTAFHSIDNMPSTYTSGLTFSGALPPIARFDGTAAIYLFDGGGVHTFPNQSILNAFGYSVGQEANLPGWIYDDLAHPEDMQLVVQQSSAPEIYYMQSGKKSHIINKTAYTTLGSPVYSSQPTVRLSNAYVQSLPTGAPIMPEGTYVQTSDTKVYGIWDGSNLQTLQAGAAADLNLPIDYTAPAAVLGQLPAATTTLGKLAKDSGSNLFLLDRAQKFALTSSQLANLGLNSNNFVTADDVFLGRLSTNQSLPTAPTPTLLRVNGAPAVYLVQNGQAYLVSSRADFDALGYNMGNVVNVNGSTFGLFTVGPNLLASGQLVRIDSGAAVYLIDYAAIGNFAKLNIPSRALFDNYGFNMGTVRSLPSDALNGYATAGNLSQVVKDGSGTFWLVDSSVRHKIPATLLGASYYNINQSATLQLTDTSLNLVPAGADLTDTIQVPDQPAVYAVQNGQKSVYTSRAAFENHGGNWDQITSVSASYAASLPDGPAITN